MAIVLWSLAVPALNTAVARTAASVSARARVVASNAPPMTWKELKEALDCVPVFALVDGAQEQRGDRFFVDPMAAEQAIDSMGEDGLFVQPVGLGAALGKVQDGGAVFEPVDGDILAARGMEGGERADEGLPLFSCYQMRLPSKTGSGTVTPLFLGLADAEAALAKAAPGGGLSLVTVTLEHMADLMMAGQLRDPRSMAFVPTRRAVEYCNAVGARRRIVRSVEDLTGGGSEPPSGGALPGGFGI
tara:strand:+ start:2050 stop:2784 length:735 start_codon:yes stop_codon:yes gene_type:complete